MFRGLADLGSRGVQPLRIAWSGLEAPPDRRSGHAVDCAGERLVRFALTEGADLVAEAVEDIVADCDGNAHWGARSFYQKGSVRLRMIEKR